MASADDRRRGEASRGRSAARQPGSGTGSARTPGARKAAPRAGAARATSGKAAPARATSGKAAQKPAPRSGSGRRGGRPVTTASYLQAPGTATRAAASARRTAPAARGGSRRPRSRPQTRGRRSSALVLLAAAALVAAGTFGGYGIGRAVEAVRAVWPEPAPQLLADKAVPPEPIDLSGPADTCRPEELDVRLAASATTLTEGDPVVFSIQVENVGRAPCLVDGADASRAVTITDASGGDRVWSSGDCASGSQPLMLGPGDVAPERDVRWSAVRSAPGCEGGRPRVGPGEYRAVVTLADVPGARSDVVELTVVGRPTPTPTPVPTPEAPAPTPTPEEPAPTPSAEG